MNPDDKFSESKGPLNDLQEISRQMISLVDGSGADNLRLQVSEWRDGQWVTTGLLALPMNGESRLEIVLLKEPDSILRPSNPLRPPCPTPSVPNTSSPPPASMCAPALQPATR